MSVIVSARVWTLAPVRQGAFACTNPWLVDLPTTSKSTAADAPICIHTYPYRGANLRGQMNAIVKSVATAKHVRPVHRRKPVGGTTLSGLSSNAKRARSATIVQARARCLLCRRDFQRQRDAAVVIQLALRKKRMRLAWAEAAVALADDDPDHVAAVQFVTFFLAMKESPLTAKALAANYFTPGFVDERHLPEGLAITKGTPQYLSGIRLIPPRQDTTLVYVPPRVALFQDTKAREKSASILVEYEACLGGSSDVRFEFTLVNYKGETRMSKRRMVVLEPPDVEMSTGKHDTVASPLEDKLRTSFTTLDVDCSGSLSLREVATATELVGLHFSKQDLAQQLRLDPETVTDESLLDLQAFNRAVRKDRALEVEAGLQPSDIAHRPLLLDVLPLVSRSLAAHQVVEGCLREGKERNAQVERANTNLEGTRRQGELTTVEMLALMHLRQPHRSVRSRITPDGDAMHGQEEGTTLSRPGWLRSSRSESQVCRVPASTLPPINEQPAAKVQRVPAIFRSLSEPRVRGTSRRAASPKSTRGLPPIVSITGLVAALPPQESSATKRARGAQRERPSRRSHELVSSRIADRRRTPWS